MPCLDVYRFCGPVEGSGEPSLLRCSDGSYTNDASTCTPLAPAGGCDASQGQYPDKDSCCAAFRTAYKDHPGYLQSVCNEAAPASSDPGGDQASKEVPSSKPPSQDVPPSRVAPPSKFSHSSACGSPSRA